MTEYERANYKSLFDVNFICLDCLPGYKLTYNGFCVPE